ncbi:MAG: DUF4179 domain-containing protein [Candidatus Limnocylindrales bacterium]
MMHRSLTAGMPEDLESLLVEAYAAEIPADLAATLEKRAAAVTPWHPQTPRFPRLALPRLSLTRRRGLAIVPVLVAILLGAAVLMSTSASGGPAAFYEAEGGYMWDHAQVLGLTKTVDGYQITLERAYADANRMMVGVTVVDTQNRWSLVNLGGVSVVDSVGGEWMSSGGSSDPVSTTTTPSISEFEYTPGLAPPGRREFSVTVSSISVDPPSPPAQQVAVNATFSFELTVGGGSQATPLVSSESNGVTITLERIITSPSAVRLELRLAGAPSSGDSWMPNVYVSHAGQSLDGLMSTTAIGGSLTTVYTAGVQDPTGDWAVTASELIGSAPTEGSPWEHEVRFQGNWTLHFSMP